MSTISKDETAERSLAAMRLKAEPRGVRGGFALSGRFHELPSGT